MAAEPALALRGVTKRFGGLAVCDDVSLEVPAGARMALIGPNGAGKTTLFNLISGVYPIDGGEIELHGQPIHHLPPGKRVHAGLSRSFQNIRLMPQTAFAKQGNPCCGSSSGSQSRFRSGPIGTRVRISTGRRAASRAVRCAQS